MRIVLALLVSLIVYSFADASVSDAKIQRLVKEYDRLSLVQALVKGNLPQPLPQDPGQPYPHPRPNPPPGGGYDPDDGNCGPHYPTPDKRDCINTMCKYVGPFECDSQDDLEQISMACRNVSARCVNTVCNHVGKFECDDLSEMQTVGSICRGITDPSCINFVCSKLSKWDCDDLDELRRVAQQCR